MQFAEQPIGGAFKGGALFKHFFFSLQGAKGFYNQLFILASLFWFFIRRSKTAAIVQNLVYIILDVKQETNENDGNSKKRPL